MTVYEHNHDGLSAGDERPLTPSRRRLLETLTVGGSLLLAGCGGKDSDDPNATSGGQSTPTSSTPTDDAHQVQSQTFRAPTRQDPAKASFYRGGRTLQNTAYAGVAKEPVSYGLRVFLRPPGVWTNGQLVNPLGLGGEAPLQFSWLENIDRTPTEVTVTIREDATWSDGHPITATDIAVPPLERTLQQFLLPTPAYAPASQTESQAEPAWVLGAFDDFEIGEKTVTYRSSAGLFEQFYEKAIALWFGPIYPPISPTHVAPFDAFADAVIETVRRAQAGEIYPWYGRGVRDPNRKTLIRELLGDPKYVRKFTNPDNVLAIGAWDLAAVDGKDVVFEPNPHSRHGDTINFETVRFEFTKGTQRLRAAVQADRLDFGRLGTTPQAVVESFPDDIEILRVPGGPHTGNELQMNFDHPALGTREVRLAIMYALDQATIANNIHPSVAVPITTPGGDSWHATTYASQEWIDETLTTYPQDRERAANLLREAGYARDGRQWLAADGEPLALTLPTASTPPTWEPTVASQLSEFGIDTTVRTVDGNAFARRRDEGEFAVWAASKSAIMGIWRNAATSPDTYGIYPDEQFETGEFSDNGAPIPRTEARWRVFTIQAPPVGQPDGPLQEYHPAAAALLRRTNPPAEEFRRRMKMGMWLHNWYLPTIPINKQYVQHFIDRTHWIWPTDTLLWKNFTNGLGLSTKGMMGDLPLRANPDNPEDGPAVGDG